MKSSFICPYCFDRIKMADLQLRCTNRRCMPEPDIQMAAYEQGIPVASVQPASARSGGHCFPARMHGRGLPSGECDKCGETSHKCVCPSCHNALPEATLNGTDMIISIVGARGSGKSVYVGVLINELIRRVAPGFGGALEGFDDSYKRYKDFFYQRMYMDKQLPDQTASSMSNANNGAYRPYVFTLRLPKTGLFAGKQVNAFTFVFFDTAGEDLNDADTMNTVNKYITESAGILFLLDPLQIEEVQSSLEESVIRNASSVDYRRVNDPNSIMTNVAMLIRHAQKKSEQEKITIPVAAVFSKFDAIESIVPEGLTILNTSPHVQEGVFDMDDWNNVNNEVKSLLGAWDYQQFISQVDNSYTNCAYFAVSALGLHNNPRDQAIDKPNPHRIEDPLLWLLKENGVIKATKFKG